MYINIFQFEKGVYNNHNIYRENAKQPRALSIIKGSPINHDNKFRSAARARARIVRPLYSRLIFKIDSLGSALKCTGVYCIVIARALARNLEIVSRAIVRALSLYTVYTRFVFYYYSY